MSTAAPSVDLGFAVAHVPPGTHVCHVYADGDERSEALLRFIARGVTAGEATACFSEKVAASVVERRFADEGLSLAAALAGGDLVLAGTRDVYFAEDRFDPDRMLELLRAFHDDAVAAGRPGARVIGEMEPEIERIPGGRRLLEYESRVNHFLVDHPVTTVCQYDARSFSGATIMDVLSVHPMVLVNGAVVFNPFFVAPERMLER